MIYKIATQPLMTGKELKKLRKKFNYSLRNFGEKVGIPYSVICNYENGKRNITPKIERQIRSALGLSYEKKSDNDLHVHLDYLRLTFFDGTLESIFSYVLDSEKRFFTYVEISAYNYDGYFILGNIRLYWTRDRPEQGIMLELSGRGLEEFESYLLEKDASFTLYEWLKLVTDPDYLAVNGIASRFNCSRLDLTINEMVQESGNYDLHDLKWKRDHAPHLIETKLRASQDIERYWKGGSEGISMYFGSPQSPFYLRMYEKSKERAAKENLSFEEALDRYQVVNRFEMQLSGEYALSCLEELTRKGDLAQYAIDLLLYKIEVFDQIEDDQGGVTYEYCRAFYNIFGAFKKIKVNQKDNQTSIEQSMEWVIYQVTGTLLMLREIFGKQWLFDWLTMMMDEAELSRKQEAQVLLEQSRVSNDENALYLWYKKKIAEQKYLPENNVQETLINDEKEKRYRIRVKQLPTKYNVYVNREGRYTVNEPEGLLLDEVHDLGERLSVDFFNSSLFVMFECS